MGFMQSRKPFYLNICLTLCNLLSYVPVGIHYFMIFVSFARVPVYLLNGSEKRFKYLRSIWYARIVRRMISVLVRSPLRKSTLRIVDFNIPVPVNSSCIILICHTAWKRLLVQWCLEKDFGLILSNGKLTQDKRLLQSQGEGFKELRKVLNYMHSNGRIILSADVFNNLNNCPVQFLGKQLNASFFPVRLARVAHAPLIVAIPTLCNGTISFIIGPQFDNKMIELNSSSIIQSIISFLEKEISKCPSICPEYVY
jgi:hypothetical protein